MLKIIMYITFVAQFIGPMLVQYIPNIFSLAKHWEYIGPYCINEICY